MKKTILFVACLFIALTMATTQGYAASQSAPQAAYIIEDGKGIHIKEWIYKHVRVPENCPVDSLQGKVNVCVTITKQGKLIYIPIGYNNPQMLAEVEKVLNKDVHCVTQKIWDSRTGKQEDVDYTSYEQIYFRYVKPKVEPAYVKASSPRKITKENMFTSYRGDLVYSSFQQSPTLKESIDKFRKWVSSRIVFPQEAVAQGIEGNFSLTFIINENCKLEVRNVVTSPSPIITKEVLRVVAEASEWIPTMRWNYTKQRYDYIRSSFILPLVFNNSNN